MPPAPVVPVAATDFVAVPTGDGEVGDDDHLACQLSGDDTRSGSERDRRPRPRPRPARAAAQTSHTVRFRRSSRPRPSRFRPARRRPARHIPARSSPRNPTQISTRNPTRSSTQISTRSSPRNPIRTQTQSSTRDSICSSTRRRLEVCSPTMRFIRVAGRHCTSGIVAA